LPGEGALSNFAVFIAAYILAGVVIGAAAGWLVAAVETTPTRTPSLPPQANSVAVGRLGVVAAAISIARYRWLKIAIACLAIALGLFGARQRVDDLRVDSSVLVTRPDVRAAAWIQNNTPQDARFLVNTFFAYGDTTIVGSDGGWWLPLLARRRTNLPPINYTSESGSRLDYREWINALPLEIQKKGIEHPDVWAALRERGITHIYIGQRQGRVNYGGSFVLQPAQLLANPRFRLIYHQDRVWVFEVIG
jgi:hypothetical protein